MCKHFFLVAFLALLLSAAFEDGAAPGAAPVKDGATDADRYGDPLPPGAVARLGTVRWRHSFCEGSDFTRVSFSPDGKLLLSCGACGLCLWNVHTGKQVHWSPDSKRIRVAAFSPDGKTLITQTNESRGTWVRDHFQVKGLFDHWDVTTGKRLHQAQFEFSERDPSLPFVSSDGKLFVLNDHKDEIHLWEAQTGKHLLHIEQQVIRPWINLSVNNQLLALSSVSGNLHLYDRVSGKELRRITYKKDPVSEGLFAPALSPNGKLVAASTSSTLCVLDTATGELKREFKNCRGRVSFSADGKYLACGDERGIRLWETTSFRELRRFEESPDSIRALEFSADGQFLASTHEHTVELWEVATGKRLSCVPSHHSPVHALTFTPSGSGLVSGTEIGTMIVWDRTTTLPRYRLSGGHLPVKALSCSPDGKLLATGEGYYFSGHEAQIRLWSLTDGKLVRQFTGHLNGVSSLAFSPDGKRLVSGGLDARFRVWDPVIGKRLYQIRGGDGWRALAFSPNGNTLVLGSSGGELGLWKADTGQKLIDLGVQRNRRRQIVYTSFLRDGKVVISEEHPADQATPPKMRFWDTDKAREIRSFPLNGAYAFNDAVASGHGISADGSLGATVAWFSEGPAVQLWDLSSGKLLALLHGHKGTIHALAFSPDGKLLASGSDDTTILIWDVEKARTQHHWSELLSGTVDEKNVQALAASSSLAVSFLKDRLTRSAEVEARARRLLTQLDDDQFAVREKASQELKSLGYAVPAVLRQALKENPTPETRRRIRIILDSLKSPNRLETVLDPERAPIAIMLLEQIATAESRRTIEVLAQGPAGTVVTRAARVSLDGLKKPAKSH